MPGNIPLLSNMGKTEGHSLYSGQKGTFSAIQRNDPSRALADIEFIVRSMVGQANARNSIPDIRAQNLCFRYMMRNINNDRTDAIGNVYTQWCGALCAYILSPLVMAVCPGLSWQHIVAKDLNTPDDRLGRAIYNSLNIPDSQSEQIDWHLLILQHNKTCIPILDYSKDQLAVPSASLEDSKIVSDVFPWVAASHQFENPVDCLSLQALEYIDQWLAHFVMSVSGTKRQQDDELLSEASRFTVSDATTPGKQPKDLAAALQAIQNFRHSVQARMEMLKLEDPYRDVWMTILQALLMRDLIDSGVYVVSVEDRMGSNRFARDMEQAPTDDTEQRTHEGILKRFSYAVFLGHQFLGFLDTTCGLWLYAPGYFGQTAEYRQLLQTVQRHLAQSELRQAYYGQLEHFMGSFTLASPLDSALRRQLEGVDVTKIYTLHPELKQLRQGEVTAPKRPFEMMGRICGYRCDDGRIFTQKLFLYPSTDQGIYEFNHNNKWGIVNSAQEEKYRDRKALLPLTACGVTIVRNSEALQYDAVFALEQDKDPEKIRATLRVQHGLVEYEWRSVYGNSTTKLCEVSDMPAVCYWPNGVANEGDPPWKIYYTYVHFHEKDVPIRYASSVYNANGNKLTRNTLPVIQFLGKDSTHYAWQTHPSNVPPSFCTLEEDGQCLGSVLFGKPETFPAFTRDALLAIDFGTTTTTGAVLLDKNRKGNISTPLFTHSVLKWEMKGVFGSMWSLNQFVADQLNCLGSHNGSGAFFSAFARFTPQERVREEQPSENEELQLEPADAYSTSQKPLTQSARAQRQNLFIDGHIYYYGDSMHNDNPMGNHRYVGLKLRELENGLAWAEDNISMFLRQVLEMYLLYCRLNGSRVKSILFAYPLAFSTKEQEIFRGKVRVLLSQLVENAGLEPFEPDIRSESQAVCAYFASIPRIQAAMLDKGIITLDIGGGTTDYSHCMVNKNAGNLCEFYSNFMGGQRMLAEYPYQCKRLVDGGNRVALEWLYEGLQQVADQGSDDVKTDIAAFLTELRGQTVNQKESFVFCIDRFVSLRPEVFRTVLQTPAFHEQYMLLLLELTLLLWFGYLVGMRSQVRDNTRDLPIYLAGNGSNLFTMISQADLAEMQKVICEQGKVNLTVVPSDRPKREVAEGLLQSVVTFGDGKSQCELGAPSTPGELWTAFSSLIARFVNAFEAHDGKVLECLKDVLGAREKSAKEQFLARNQSLQELCVYLVTFCDIIISHLTNR